MAIRTIKITANDISRIILDDLNGKEFQGDDWLHNAVIRVLHDHEIIYDQTEVTEALNILVSKRELLFIYFYTGRDGHTNFGAKWKFKKNNFIDPSI